MPDPSDPYVLAIVREGISNYSASAAWGIVLAIVADGRLDLGEAALAFGYVVAYEGHVLAPDDPPPVLPTEDEDDADEAAAAPLGRRFDLPGDPPRSRLTRIGRMASRQMPKSVEGGFVRSFGSAVATDEWVTRSARMFLVRLQFWSGGRTGIYAIGTSLAAAWCGVHRSTIWRWTQELVEAGLVWASTPKTGRDRYGATQYLLLGRATAVH